LSIKFGVLLVLLAVRDALVERCPRGGKFGLCVCELLSAVACAWMAF